MDLQGRGFSHSLSQPLYLPEIETRPATRRAAPQLCVQCGSEGAGLISIC